MLKDNLITLRNLHGFSQEQLSERIGISRQAYAKWETGATVPDIDKCQKLAELYGVTTDSLVTTQKVDGIGKLPPAPVGKNIWGSVTMGDRGQIIIPKQARDKFGLKGGDRLIVLSDDEGMALIKAETFEGKIKAILACAQRPID